MLPLAITVSACHCEQAFVEALQTQWNTPLSLKITNVYPMNEENVTENKMFSGPKIQVAVSQINLEG